MGEPRDGDRLDSAKHGQCAICLEHIHVHNYVAEGDTLECEECGAQYILACEEPVRLSIMEETADPDDEYDDLFFDD